MNTISTSATLLTHSLAWALLYSLWQGLLLYLCVLVLLKAIPGMSPRTRYNLSFGASMTLIGWFANTWVTQYGKLKGITVWITQGSADAVGAHTIAVHSAEQIAGGRQYFGQLLPVMERWHPVIVAVYTAGLACMALRLLLNIRQVHTLRSRGLMETDARLFAFAERSRQQLGISRNVQVWLSDRVNVPVMIGALKPMILLPVAAMNYLTMEQAETILLHELAHIKRNDYLLNMIQAAAEALLFFNPFLWLLSGIMKRERELCCDDIVVSSSPDTMAYARALAILESCRAGTGTLALAATGNNHQLFHRIKRIMEMKKKNLSYSQLTIIAVAMIAVTLTISMFAFTPSFAQKAKSDKTDKTGKSDTTRKSIYHYKTVTIDKNGKKTVTERTTTTPDKDLEAEANDRGNVNTSSYTYTRDDNDAVKKMVENITKITKESMSDVDMSGIKKEMDRARNEIDQVDWDKIHREIRKSIDEVNAEMKKSSPKISKDINEGVKAILESTLAMIDDVHDQLKDAIPAAPAPPAMPDELSAPMPPVAPVAPMPPGAPSMHADGTTNYYEKMLDRMERDGLIDRNRKFSVMKDGDELFINGDKQPESVFNKYHHYLRDRYVNIKGKKGALNINIDN